MRGKRQSTVVETASTEGLPHELAEFLSKDTYSLLIKGESGTGKTILALTILKSIQPIDNLLYISTRTSPLQLVENYPWVEDIFGPATTMEDLKGKESEGWENLVDARLDEPNVVFERITNVLMDRQAPTVVIDSWESLGDTLGSEALRTNIRVLQTWRERAGARFIFVGEDPGTSAIDFMVEGVTVLKDKVSGGRRIREMVLSKLHGVQISRPSYLFTLQGGTFTSFPPYSPRDYAFKNPLPVSFDRPFRRAKSRFPTGYTPLDNTLDGGFPARSMGVVEVDRRVDMRVGLIFISRTIQDWIASGDTVQLSKIREVEPQYLSQFVKSFAGGSKGKINVFKDAEPGKAKGLRVRDGPTKARTLEVVNANRVKGREEQPPDLTVILGRSGEIEEDDIRKAAVHLKVFEIDGTLFLESELPWSSLFAIVPGMTGGNPMMRLEPIV